jgi:hypothetical protein
LVKLPPNPYAQFFGERSATGDFKGIAAPERGALIANEWRALSAGEKKVCL